MGILQKIGRGVGGFLRRYLGSPRPSAPKVKPSVGRGHRGIRAESLKMRDRRAEEFAQALENAGRTGQRIPADVLPRFTEEEIAQWKPIESDEATAFVYDNELIFVHSSNVATLQYFLEDKKLIVGYLNGSSYVYSGVTEEEAIRFVKAFSKGAEVWDTLRVRGSRTAHKKPYMKLRGPSVGQLRRGRNRRFRRQNSTET